MVLSQLVVFSPENHSEKKKQLQMEYSLYEVKIKLQQSHTLGMGALEEQIGNDNSG